MNARYLAFDISTTAVSAGVRDEQGNEGFAAIPMRGATTWHGQPAFQTATLPEMINESMCRLAKDGWDFSNPGDTCASVRQHDMVLIGPDGEILIPFISWQCNAATAQVARLREMGAEAVVGRIEPRFILPKLMWALAEDPALAKRVQHVLTTGDYVAWQLTGQQRLSTSDALSNGLLSQKTKQLAVSTFKDAGLDPAWFASPVQSGGPVGKVRRAPAGSVWQDVARMLEGWTVRGCLGDNHAGGVGSGLADYETIVISLGSSGTVIRKCLPDASLAGHAASFEYFADKLLLMMLADCAVWYERFTTRFNPDNLPHAELDRLALSVPASQLQFVQQVAKDGGWTESFPAGWDSASLAVKVASTQASIAIHMLRLVRAMLNEVRGDGQAIRRFALTGGLSRSPFLQHVLSTGLGMLRPGSEVLVSGRRGPLANKAAVLGALFTAMVGTPGYPDLSAVIDRLAALKPVPPAAVSGDINSFIAAHMG